MKVVLEAVESGKIAYRLTSPDEIIAILGEPQTRQERDGGGMLALDVSYPGIEFFFARSKGDKDASYTLRGLTVRGEEIDIGGILQGQRQVVVRSIRDFHRIGIENVDLRNLDLSGEGGGNKTMASYQGTNVYTYTRDGGMSWTAPYLAGLAALAFQVNPGLPPQTIVEQLLKRATPTEAGPVVNPRGFVESVKPADPVERNGFRGHHSRSGNSQGRAAQEGHGRLPIGLRADDELDTDSFRQ